MIIRKSVNLLTIKGVSPADLSVSVAPRPTYRIAVYTQIPPMFQSVDAWPKMSNRKCWTCDLVPSDYPKFVPMNPTYKHGQLSYDAHGHFNTWNCAVEYVMTKIPQNNRGDILSYIYDIAGLFSGKPRAKILPAPPKTLMRAYCGDSGLSPEEYMEKIDELNAEYNTANYRLADFSVFTNCT
jgi:hypothetical protein